MIAQLRAQRPAIAAVCQRYAVARLELFGPASTGAFDPDTSDLDCLVAFGDHPTLSRFEQYFGLHEGLQELLGRPVDLVMIGALRNPSFIRGVNASRQFLYAA